ncbi:DUF397 domain-containing protein [Lentzea sp. NPDC004789]
MSVRKYVSIRIVPRSAGSSNNCVEVGQGVGIRDSKAPTTHIPVSADAWSAFLKLTTGLA